MTPKSPVLSSHWKSHKGPSHIGHKDGSLLLETNVVAICVSVTCYGLEDNFSIITDTYRAEDTSDAYLEDSL